MYLCRNTSRGGWQLSVVAGDSLNAVRVLVYGLDDKSVEIQSDSKTVSF